jgi:cytochrome P450
MGVATGKRLPALFSTTNEPFHANPRRSVNNAFSVSTLVQYESFINDVTKKFLDQRDQFFAKPGKVCDPTE